MLTFRVLMPYQDNKQIHLFRESSHFSVRLFLVTVVTQLTDKNRPLGRPSSFYFRLKYQHPLKYKHNKTLANLKSFRVSSHLPFHHGSTLDLLGTTWWRASEGVSFFFLDIRNNVQPIIIVHAFWKDIPIFNGYKNLCSYHKDSAFISDANIYYHSSGKFQ